MIAIRRNCLDSAELERVLSGQMDKDDFDSAISHLDNCDTCRTAADELQQQGRWMVESLECNAPDPLQVETACQVALWRMLETPAVNPTAIADTVPCDSLGPYQLIRALGTGGMGTVYLAEHDRLKRQCAIKLLPRERVDQPGWLERFDREMTTIAALEHPNVVRANDAGHQEGWHYLVMEHLDGLDVGRIASRMGPLQVADACEIARQAALGLAHIHNAGLVHRDVKPSNLMLTRRGDVKILDLGLVLAGDDPLHVDDRLTTVGHLMGTMPYMAPEQLADSRDVDPRADIYSLGATLYRLITGRPPHQRRGGIAAQVLAITGEDPPPLDSLREDVDRDVVRLVAEMLSRDPSKRPATAQQVALSLQPLGDGSRLKGLLREALRRQPGEDERASVMPSVSFAASQPPTNRFRKWVAGGFFAAFLFLIAIVIKIQTDKGELIVHSAYDDLTILIKQDDEVVDRLVINSDNENRKILHKGSYRVEVEGGGDAVMLSDEVVTIGRGTETPVRVLPIRPANELAAEVQTSPPVIPGGGRLAEPTYRGKKLDEWLDMIDDEQDLDALGEAVVGAVTLAVNKNDDDQTRIYSVILKRARELGGMKSNTPPPEKSSGYGITDSEHFMWYIHEVAREMEFRSLAGATAAELQDGNGRSSAACLYILSMQNTDEWITLLGDASGRLTISHIIRQLAGVVGSTKEDDRWKDLPDDLPQNTIDRAYQLALRLCLIRDTDPMTIPPIAATFHARRLEANKSIEEQLVRYQISGDPDAYDQVNRAVSSMSLGQRMSQVIGDKLYEAEQKHNQNTPTIDETEAPMLEEPKGILDTEARPRDELLYQGKNLASWLGLLGREQDPNELGNVIRAVEVLTRDTEQRAAASVATLETARRFGGIVSAGIVSDAERSGSSTPASQLYMAYLLEVFPRYTPEPGLAAITFELTNGNSKSRHACIWLLNNYLGHVYSGAIIPHEDLLAKNWIKASYKTPEGKKLIDSLVGNLRIVVETFQGGNREEKSSAKTAAKAGLRLLLMTGKPIAGHESLESYVSETIQEAEAAWKREQINPQAAAGTNPFGGPIWIVEEATLLAAAKLADGKENVNWAFFASLITDNRVPISGEWCDQIFAIVMDNAPEVLMNLIERKLQQFLVPGSGPDHFSTANAGFLGGGTWSPQFVLGQSGIWATALPFYAEHAKTPADALALLRKLRDRLIADRIEESSVPNPLANIDGAIKILEGRTK